jgi:putative FmdB family regulatory protein
VPIYVYRCADGDCGHRFERLVRLDADPPPCPECGGDTRKLPAGPRLGGRTGASGSAERTPIPLRGLRSGGPEKLRREVQFRQRLETAGSRETDAAPGE